MPLFPVALKVTVVSPVADAVRVFAPAIDPSCQLVTAATPAAPVAMGVVGLTVPPPEATANVTATPATGLPNWSVTFAAGGIATGEPAVALCPSPADLTSCVAAP